MNKSLIKNFNTVEISAITLAFVGFLLKYHFYQSNCDWMIIAGLLTATITSLFSGVIRIALGGTIYGEWKEKTYPFLSGAACGVAYLSILFELLHWNFDHTLSLSSMISLGVVTGWGLSIYGKNVLSNSLVWKMILLMGSTYYAWMVI
jgi:hypothetical protein